MNIDYNAYLPTAKDIALKDRQEPKYQSKKRERVDYQVYAFMHKDKASAFSHKPFANLK